MSCGASSNSSKSTTNTNSTTKSNAASDPWSPSIPYLTSFLQDASGTRANLGPSSDQLDAFSMLKNNAAAGDPFTSQITQLANDQFNTGSNSGMVMDSYGQLQKNLGDYANGSRLDFASNPFIQQMLKSVGDDTQNRINQMFAGAGRDLSGINQQAVGRGVTNAELPILSNLYTQEEQNQINAANALNTAGANAATTGQSLDANSLATRAGGITTGNAAINAQNYAPNTVLNLDQQLKEMPLNDLSLYASLLLPAAGLGGSQSGLSNTAGTSTTKGSGSSFGIKI